jgi:hypothetical protein
MITKTIVATLLMSSVCAVGACSKGEHRSQPTAGTTGTTGSSTDAVVKAGGTESTDRQGTLTEDEARQLGIDAVVYGYPLVIVDVTKQVQTNVTTPEHNGRAPINQFSNFLKYPTAADRDVVRMNVDTLYSFAWLDLSKEPLVLSVPDTHGRYNLMPIIDAWTDVFASPGKRTTGTEAGDFAIVGPNWTGTLPAGMKPLKSPTNMAIIAGRTQANGPADYVAVNAIQKQYHVTPLSAFGKPYTPPAGVVDPKIDMKTPPVEQVNRMSAETFFNRLATLMASNPPAAADAPMLAKLARIGVVPGRPFDMSSLDPAIAKGLDGSVQTAVTQLVAGAKEIGTPVNGWRIPPMTLADFGTDYKVRSEVALFGLGANLAKDAVYPTAFVDGEGQPLTGGNRYALHFDKGGLPPVNAFWSLTMYDAESFFSANPIHRYSIAGWMPLKYNPDGSLDVYIQHDSPGTQKESNWLPAPEGAFNVTLRMYWPKEAVLDGTWKPPAIEKAQAARTTQLQPHGGVRHESRLRTSPSFYWKEELGESWFALPRAESPSTEPSPRSFHLLHCRNFPRPVENRRRFAVGPIESQHRDETTGRCGEPVRFFRCSGILLL